MNYSTVFGISSFVSFCLFLWVILDKSLFQDVKDYFLKNTHISRIPFDSLKTRYDMFESIRLKTFTFFTKNAHYRNLTLSIPLHLYKSKAVMFNKVFIDHV